MLTLFMFVIIVVSLCAIGALALTGNGVFSVLGLLGCIGCVIGLAVLLTGVIN